ncbi:guanine nucleotide exchange factor sdo1 [Hanseniaspora vineae]
MGLINQPMGQIRLTNVSLVRLKRNKKRFELACYQNKVQDYRKGIEKNLDDVLQINQVFLNVSKGQVAPNEDLMQGFGTTDQDTVIKFILEKGELQLSDKERQLRIQQINNEMLNIVSCKCINPKSKKRYPPTMIHKALQQLKFNISISKPAKIQALEAIKLLVAEQVIPIVRAKMLVKITLQDARAPEKDRLELLFLNKKISTGEDSGDRESWVCEGLIDPVSYKEIVTIFNNNKNLGVVQVLDMAVIDNN